MSDQNQYTTNESFSGGSEVEKKVDIKDFEEKIIEDQKKFDKQENQISQIIEVLRKLLDDYSKKFNENENKQNEIQKNLEKTGENLKKTREEIEKWKDDKVNLIEILGIFVAIFTFVSVEIQILKGVTDYLRVAGLSILLFSGLSFFLLVLFFVSENWVRKNNESEKYKHFYKKSFVIFIVLVFISLIFGIVLVTKGDYNNPANIKNNRNFIELKNENTKLEKEVNTLRLDIKEIKNDQTEKK